MANIQARGEVHPVDHTTLVFLTENQGTARYARHKFFWSAFAVLDGVVPVRPNRRAGIFYRFSFAWKTPVFGATYFHANENPSRTAPCTTEGIMPSVSSEMAQVRTTIELFWLANKTVIVS